jgi:L-lactate utilization protein LutB
MGEYYNSFSDWSDKLAPRIQKALQARHFEAYYCKTASEAKEQALKLIPEGSSISWGGSVTIREIGLIDSVESGGYRIIDRDRAKTQDERFELMRQALLCDAYLTSVNAISEDGQFVNVDGVGNRVAAIAFGPRTVIAVVGMNKACKTLEDAYSRARNHASPLNAVRLNLKTPCNDTGSCVNCKSDDCICSYIVATRMSRVPGRIKIILVGEPLGL